MVAPVVDEAPPSVEGVPVGGSGFELPTPPTVELYGVVCGSPGLARFTPGVLTPPSEPDGVPIVAPVVVPVDVDEAPGVVVDDGSGIVVDDELGVPPIGGVSCEIVGLRSLGTSGRDDVPAVVVPLGRTRSPSGMPSESACPPRGRGPSSTNSDAANSVAR